ncbi:MAG: FAD-dependent oxidoreductase [Wenzhouxiangella sp.]|nr:MAG: FAD-dependent oxidoreductase [Wenzhouxiangella sp.]
MKIVIVGAGVAGLYAAWHLSGRHEVVVLEADDRLGGHADTHRVEEDGRELWIDSGFIVFNETHYPLLSRWFEDMGVAWRDSNMSFAVSDQASGLEYNATDLNRLFCQRKNLISPAFWGMFRDIVRFYRDAPGLLSTLDDKITLGRWLDESAHGSMFGEQHLLPMASALWSAPMGRIVDFPMLHLLKFMDNHNMLQLSGRPTWRTVSGGSRSYVEKAARCGARFETASPVRSIRREPDRVVVCTDRDQVEADEVVLACHADQALALLQDAGAIEQQVLGAVDFQPNETVLHTDSRVLPRLPAARAAWNVRRDPTDRDQCRVSYYMNLLQGIDSRQDYVVSLNQSDRIDPDHVLVKRKYSHPVFTQETVAAQQRWDEVNGTRRTWFCGAWWGWGFHEDGARSARRVVDHIERRHG